jgi:hypothetical protein
MWVVSTKPRPLYPRERPGTHCTGGWVGPRAVLNVCEKSRPTGIRSSNRPARSQSLYRLSYPVPSVILLHKMPTVNIAYSIYCMGQTCTRSGTYLELVIKFKEITNLKYCNEWKERKLLIFGFLW